jgi:hypothetical protein
MASVEADDAPRASDILTVADVASELHCSRTHICHLAKGMVKGVSPLPAIVLGRRMIFRRVSFERWLRANEKNGTMALPEVEAVRPGNGDS